MSPDHLALGSVPLPTIMGAIGRLIYEPRKIWGVMMKAASEKDSPKQPRFQRLEQKIRKEKRFKEREILSIFP